MKAVLDEINGAVAVFVVDEPAKTFYQNVASLPAGARVGDVFAVNLRADDTFALGEILPNERKRREASSRAKRAELLKRSRKNK